MRIKGLLSVLLCSVMLTACAAPFAAREEEDVIEEQEEAEDTEEAIDALTIEGAVLLGKYDDLGSIEPGKAADFAIFDNDPFACDVDQLKKLKCVMTVVGGQITYDASEDTAREWAETLTDTYF